VSDCCGSMSACDFSVSARNGRPDAVDLGDDLSELL
jgi:hypothetical protein